MSGHTPGPWQTLPEECDKPYIRIRGTTPGLRFKVANVLTPVYDGVPEREATETRANARLIATAPDLLEALRLCEGVCDPDGALLGLVRAAIAKAIGVEA